MLQTQWGATGGPRGGDLAVPPHARAGHPGMNEYFARIKQENNSSVYLENIDQNIQPLVQVTSQGGHGGQATSLPPQAQAKTRTMKDSKEIMKKRRERAICIVSTRTRLIFNLKSSESEHTILDLGQSSEYVPGHTLN